MAETFVCFAYGSNMLSGRLKERTSSAVIVGTGFVNKHRLAFDKVSIDGSGKCDMETTTNPADRVYGVLYRIDKSEEKALDRAEGLGSGYQKGWFDVLTSDGLQKAIAYFADRKNPNLPPYHWYKNFVVTGANEHGLPLEYISAIQEVKSIEDPDDARRLKNEAVLAGTPPKQSVSPVISGDVGGKLR